MQVESADHVLVEFPDLPDLGLNALALLGDLELLALHPRVHLVELAPLLLEVAILLLHQNFVLAHKRTHLV